MTNEMIDAKVTQINLLAAQKKEIEAMMDALKGDLKAELDSRQEDVIDTGLNRVFYKAVQKTVVDTDKLKAEGKYEEFSKPRVDIMFKITSVTKQ